jgi:hypothetical protein
MTDMLKNEEARPDMDDLLHDYFQAELPRPWPTFQAPRAARTKRPASLWSRYSGRIALAACIALLAAGYLTLAGYFPRMQTPTGVIDINSNIGEHKKEGKGVLPKLQPDAPLPTPADNR